MFDRFTRKSRIGRGPISKGLRLTIYKRDSFRCQFCDRQLRLEECTIDHLVPLALGGLDEPINYVTACEPCNRKKAAMPLEAFAADLGLAIPTLPVRGDPILDNTSLPPAIRAIRKRIHDRVRMGELRAGGRGAQKKIEREYRRELWRSELGNEIEEQAPSLPGHARVMIPEIDTIAANEDERLLLIELSKSANARNLIGGVLGRGCDVIGRVERLAASSPDLALRKRLDQALARYRSARRRNRKDE